MPSCSAPLGKQSCSVAGVVLSFSSANSGHADASCAPRWPWDFRVQIHGPFSEPVFPGSSGIYFAKGSGTVAQAPHTSQPRSSHGDIPTIDREHDDYEQGEVIKVVRSNLKQQGRIGSLPCHPKSRTSLCARAATPSRWDMPAEVTCVGRTE